MHVWTRTPLDPDPAVRPDSVWTHMVKQETS